MERNITSGVTFEKAKRHSKLHNFRVDKPSYLLKKEDQKGNEYLELSDFNDLWEENIKYFKKGGQKPLKANSCWEALVNIKKDSTIEDVKKLAAHIEEKFGLKALDISIHRDEGHYDEESGEALYNLHAHVRFFTLKEGKQKWRRALINPEKMRELQTEAAEILGMERGIDVRESGKMRLPHQLWRYVAPKLEMLEKLSKKIELESPQVPQISKIWDEVKENYQKALKTQKTSKINLIEKIFTNTLESKLQKLEAGLNAYKSGFKEVETLAKDAIIERERIKKDYLETKNENGKLKKENNSLTSINKGLNKDIKTLKMKIEEIEANYKKEREALKNSGQATQKDYQELKLKKEESIKAAHAPASTEKNEEETPLPRMEPVEPLSKKLLEEKMTEYFSSLKEESRSRSTAFKPKL